VLHRLRRQWRRCSRVVCLEVAMTRTGAQSSEAIQLTILLSSTDRGSYCITSRRSSNLGHHGRATADVIVWMQSLQASQLRYVAAQQHPRCRQALEAWIWCRRECLRSAVDCRLRASHSCLLGAAYGSRGLPEESGPGSLPPGRTRRLDKVGVCEAHCSRHPCGRDACNEAGQAGGTALHTDIWHAS
jgi:hypothetical protein